MNREIILLTKNFVVKPWALRLLCDRIEQMSVWNSMKAECKKLYESGDEQALNAAIETLEEQGIACGDDRVPQVLQTAYCGITFHLSNEA